MLSLSESIDDLWEIIICLYLTVIYLSSLNADTHVLFHVVVNIVSDLIS